MPDMDRLPRGVRRGWRSVASAVLGAQPPAVAADAVEKALAKTLRICGDLTWLADLDRAIRESWSEESSAPLEAFVRTLDPRVTRGVESAFIDVAREQALNGDRRAPVGPEHLVVPGLLRMVDTLCLGPLGPDLVPQVFRTQGELDHYRARLTELTDVDSISVQIRQRDFEVSGLRAPRTRLVRPGTAALLNRPIDAVA